MNILPNIRIGKSVCPHDCPSACALDVEILDAHTVGRLKGAEDNSYTLGVICEKVARYAERIHHPDRLLHPLKRKGSKGEGQFQRISWEDAMAETAEAFLAADGRGEPAAEMMEAAIAAEADALPLTACEIARLLGMEVRRDRIAPCPACGERQERTVRRLCVGLVRGERHWVCNRCGVGGDGVSLVCWSMLGREVRGLEPEQWRTLRA